MSIAILCNGQSDKMTGRVELINQMKERGETVFVGGIYTGVTNEYYGEDTASYMPIEASRNNTNPLVEIKSILSVRKQIKANKIDSVLIYGVKNHAAMVLGAKLGGAKKIVCVVNGSGNLFRIDGIKGKILRFMSFPMLKIAYALSSGVCFQNADDKQLFINKHLIHESNKIFLTGGSGTNLKKFIFQELPKEDKFLFLARITLSKGISEYIKAAELVKEKYPEVTFDIVGPLDATVENTEDSLLKQASDKGIVVYHGATDDVPGWMRKCRIFIYPSYYPEGVPRCAIQAIATGRPIITCDTPGCKETVKEGINGFKVEPHDYRSLAKKMIWMIEHPTKVEKMAIESRKYAEEKFDVEKINEQILLKLLF